MTLELWWVRRGSRCWKEGKGKRCWESGSKSSTQSRYHRYTNPFPVPTCPIRFVSSEHCQQIWSRACVNLRQVTAEPEGRGSSQVFHSWKPVSTFTLFYHGHVQVSTLLYALQISRWLLSPITTGVQARGPCASSWPNTAKYLLHESLLYELAQCSCLTPVDSDLWFFLHRYGLWWTTVLDNELPMRLQCALNLLSSRRNTYKLQINTINVFGYLRLHPVKLYTTLFQFGCILIWMPHQSLEFDGLIFRAAMWTCVSGQLAYRYLPIIRLICWTLHSSQFPLSKIGWLTYINPASTEFQLKESQTSADGTSFQLNLTLPAAQ